MQGPNFSEDLWDDLGAIPPSEEQRGTVQTHLVGKITEGAYKGRRVETSSRLLNFGPNQSLSDIDGNMIIGGK